MGQILKILGMDEDPFKCVLGYFSLLPPSYISLKKKVHPLSSSKVHVQSNMSHVIWQTIGKSRTKV